MAGDFSPLTIDASRDGRRIAPPALVVAMAVGLGTVDMPVPAIAEWEWLNWKFPRAVRAGDTIYAHWMLTQKRPPASGAPSSIVVWRVDIHTADGALCAEGEIGAKVTRSPTAPHRTPEATAAAGPARRRRRRSRTNGPAVPEPTAVAAPPAPSAKPERAVGPSRRRRRRRSAAPTAKEEEREPRGASEPESRAPAPSSPTPAGRRGIGGVLRRLRGT